MAAPVGCVDAMVIAIAERLRVPHVATTGYEMVGMMNPVCRPQPLDWVLQEG